MLTASTIGMIALIAAVFGSFLNVVISRGPRAWGLVDQPGAPRGLAWPPSQCEACGTRLRPRDLVPVISFISLGGKCARCGDGIGVRHLIVEGLAVLAAAVALWRFGPTPEAVAAAVLLFFLIALAAIDAETGFLPDALTFPLIGLGLATAGLGPGLTAALIGGLVGGGGLWLLSHGYGVVRGRQGLGGGDIKLVCAAGVWLGPFALPMVLLLASLGGLAVAFIQIARGERERDLGTELRFGPFLAAATAAVLLLGGLPSPL